MRVIDVHTLKQDLDAGRVPVLIDVRTTAEYNNGHVPDVVHLPLSELVDRVDELEEHRGGEIYLICQSGGRSGRAGQYLQSAGFKTVNVMGGTGGWMMAGYPVDRG